MVAFKLSTFGGMIPAVDDRLLPEPNAAHAVDAWVYDGALDGIREPQLIHPLDDEFAKKVFRIPKTFYDKEHMSDAWWMEFRDADTDILKAPMADDTHQRYYWACASDSPRYDTRANIIAPAPLAYAGADGYLLGIPAPDVAPGVVVVGGVATNEARSYVYTWVSAYGEEGPPSPPTLVTDNPDGSWNITMTAPGVDDTDQRNLTKVRIYRTITSSAGVATYFFVAEQDISDTTYSDTRANADVAAENQLESTSFTPPPDNLQGIVAMPGGFFAGWVDNQIWFSEPYRPHAWPVAYQLAVDNPVVGMGVVGQTLVICTKGNPYASAGVNPANMSLTKLGSNEPCMARGSIVSAPEGLYYASPNGLVLAAQGVITNVTRELMGKKEWLDMVNASMLRSARLGVAYFAFSTVRAGCFDPGSFQTDAFEQDDFTDTTTGFLIEPNETRVGVHLLSSDDNNFSIFSDIWTTELLMVQGTDVFWLDISGDRTCRPYLWRSKIFQAQQKKNLAAMRVWFDVPADAPTQNPVRNVDLEQTLAADQYGLVRVYADGRLVMCRELRTSGELFRIPSGFKAEFWQFEVEARVKVTNIQGAASVKELMSV